MIKTEESLEQLLLFVLLFLKSIHFVNRVQGFSLDFIGFLAHIVS